MAQEQEEQGQQQPKQPTTINTFSGGMVKDPLDLFKKSDAYIHARNMTNYLADGQIGGKSAEPSNTISALVTFTIIGCIFLADDQWLIFSTDNTTSEIGIFTDSTDTYVPIMNDAATLTAGQSGLNFNTSNLITGASRRGFDCGFDVYWSDGQRNPDRTLNTAACPFTVTPKVYPNPWVQNCTTSAGCVTCINTNVIDSQQLRLAPLLTTPCLKLSRGIGSGQLPNGSYQVCIAYAMNGIKCTDYIAFSDVYSTFNHLNDGGVIKLTIENIDDLTKIRFLEMEVVVVSMINQQVQAKRLGIYSTSQGTITIDLIDQTLPNIPIEKLPISSPAIVSSDAIFSLSNYLTRVGPTERPDINYQPLANQINANWVAVQYNEKYYQAGGDTFGMNVSYLRGEVYAFFIRWIYNTGDKSASYPIPGPIAGSIPGYIPISTWPVSQDTGQVVAAGTFGAYISTEIYPDHTPSVWNSGISGHPEWDLCGQPIRWFKFPSQSDFGGTTLSHFNPLVAAPSGSGFISILGTTFGNIKPPVDLNGNLVSDIVGYEILRAVRDGHQSIIAKGMINNMIQYTDNTGNQGLFQNYPYNDLRPDYYLSNNVSTVNTGVVGNGLNGASPLNGSVTDKFSFHSPDTVFNHPYLGQGALELEMILSGTSYGSFVEPWKHPMFKVLTDFDSVISTIVGVVSTIATAISIITPIIAAGNVSGLDVPPINLAATQAIPLNFPLFTPSIPTDNVIGTGSTTDPVVTVANAIISATNIAIFLAFAPIQINAIAEQMLTIIKGLIPGRQYALQYNSYGDYNTPVPGPAGSFPITDYQYIKGQVQSFQGMTVNNLYRNDYVLLSLNGSISSTGGDQSRFIWSAVGQPALKNIINSPIESYYAAYRVQVQDQYGQVDSTKQVPIGCVQQVSIVSTAAGTPIFNTPILFGGDTYINRYTEKNPMMFFNDWLVNAPEDFRYDYRNYINVPYPMFWIDNEVVTYDLLGLSHQNRRLDGPINLFPGLFYVRTGHFYLFNNGIRDFFVESSVNVGYRDWEDEITKMFYDPYGSSADFIYDYFRSDIIKSSILYKYDYSLSANRFINQYISWSQCLRRDYDPTLAYTCFSYFPRRVAYSLPQDEEQMQDNWRLFLPNNYKNFNDQVNVIKDMGKTGAIFLMENTAPYSFAGTETIASKSGTEFTVGTGLLFEQRLQLLSNVDDSYKYASCQNRMSVLNTPNGTFWTSQKTGKIFAFLPGKQYFNKGETIFDIGQQAGMKYWLLEYLPSRLLRQFPSFTLFDNPVAGVGVQLMYDSITEVLYISKKDYVANSIIQLDATGFYFISGGIRVAVTLGDPNFFQDASWTLSYDTAKKEFVSFHDWHPSYHVPSSNHFLTTTDNQLYRHNATVQSYANFYSQDFPVELQYYTNTQLTETILQSVEWILESYQYTPNTTDKFLNYDGSWDTIMLSNREQNSTIQNMTLKPWDNPYAALAYPQFIGPTRNVLYQKVENKFRCNDFYDFTNDRGQFTLANVPMFTTDPNGYTFSTTAGYMNLLKPWNQQKRFRYKGTSIFFRKSNLGNNSLTILSANTKNQLSSR
jgi:hypothetical protein